MPGAASAAGCRPAQHVAEHVEILGRVVHHQHDGHLRRTPTYVHAEPLRFVVIRVALT